MVRFVLACVFAFALLACREPRTMTVELAVDGMTCESCVQAIEHQLGGMPGVSRCTVDLAAGTATVEYREGEADPTEMAAAIDKLGYDAEPGSPEPAPVE